MGSRKKSIKWLVSLIALLETGVLRTWNALAEQTSKTPNHLRKALKGKVVTSLNHGRRYVMAKAYVKKKADRHGFFTKHRKVFNWRGNGNIRKVLIYLAKVIPWGITQMEAKEKTGRDCSRALEALVSKGKLKCRKVHGIKVYCHPKKFKRQIKTRATNKKLEQQRDPEKPEKEEDVVIPLEDIIGTFEEACRKELSDTSIIHKLCVLLVMYFKQDTYRAMDTRLKHDERIRNICHMEEHETVDFTTLCRYFTQTPFDEVKKVFFMLTNRLKDIEVIAGKYLVVDATHVFAWCNTNKKASVTSMKEQGAAFGEHQGSFFGYKVHIIIDAEAELPLAIKVTPGKRHDREMYIPLIEEVKEQYDLEEVMAVFGDGAYYDTALFEATEETFECDLNTVINPRRSRYLKKIKEMIQEVFERHGEEIETVEDAWEHIPQRTLSQYGADPGTRKESSITSAIRERLNRHLRVAVERVFSRAKHAFGLELPRFRKGTSVLKHVFMCFICMNLTALTATLTGIAEAGLKLACVY